MDKGKKIKVKYSCEKCKFSTYRKNDYTKHLDSLKHKDYFKQTFKCLKCGIDTKKSNTFHKHLETKKHIKGMDDEKYDIASYTKNKLQFMELHEIIYECLYDIKDLEEEIVEYENNLNMWCLATAQQSLKESQDILDKNKLKYQSVKNRMYKFSGRFLRDKYIDNFSKKRSNRIGYRYILNKWRKNMN